MLPFLLRRPPLLLLHIRFLSSSSSSSSHKSALVVGTLRRHGVPDGLCSSVVARFPRILTLKSEETLAPKLALFRSAGFSGPEVARILLRNPYVLLRSLRWFLAPKLAELHISSSSSSSSRDRALSEITCFRWMVFGPTRDNINVLRDRGVPEAIIFKLDESHPHPLCWPPWDLFRALEFIERLDIRPTTAAYLTAFGVLHRMSSSAIRRKVGLYEKLGWAEGEVLGMFRLRPTIMRLSDGAVRRKVAYFRDALGWGPEVLRTYPEMMTMSVGKRIAPRCAVLDLLMSRGLVRRTTRPVRELKVSEARFVEEFVERHEEAAPDAARAYYAREAEFDGWSWLKEDARNQPPKKHQQKNK